ncbi:DinB family protein [bacterium]|nr:DinB family protein [bacterium]
MDWKSTLTGAIEYNYGVTEKLMRRVDDSRLDWKPESGTNWMSTGQLLYHVAEACGSNIKGFVTGDWDFPTDMPTDASGEPDMLPVADNMPAVSSVEEAVEKLLADKALALKMLDSVSEEELHTVIAKAPWDPMEFPLAIRMLQMVDHLKQHKGQLYYYLKLQGHTVNTMDLWGV